MQKTKIAVWTILPLKFMPFDPNWRDNPRACLRSGTLSMTGSEQGPPRWRWTARQSCMELKDVVPPLIHSPCPWRAAPERILFPNGALGTAFATGSNVLPLDP